MIFGKLVAGLLGLLLAGPFGALVGLLLGHWFDRGLQHSLGFGSPEQLARIQESFFETSFLLLGHVAKADGRISEAEIAHAESIMQELGVQGKQREAAIGLFKRGSAVDFQLQETLANFMRDCSGHRRVPHTMLVFLVSLALADGVIDKAERKVLQTISTQLGYSAAAFEQMLRMIEAQSHFHNYQPSDSPRGDQLADAYLALGVESSCSDRELKRAYRKLMSQHHPDKLIAQGVPEEMIKVATEKSQEIQAAYELLSRQRRGT
jgi:DnaJ like chaperone protein